MLILEVMFWLSLIVIVIAAWFIGVCFLVKRAIEKYRGNKKYYQREICKKLKKK